MQPWTAPYSCAVALSGGAVAETPWTAPYSCRDVRGRGAAVDTPWAATYSCRGAAVGNSSRFKNP